MFYKRERLRPVFFTGAVVLAAVLFSGCNSEHLKAENELLKKEVLAMEQKTRAFQSEFNRLTAERDEQRKLRRDLEMENKKLRYRIKLLEGK